MKKLSPDPPLTALDVFHGWRDLNAAESLGTQHLLAFSEIT
jgi:hypothetical protein